MNYIPIFTIIYEKDHKLPVDFTITTDKVVMSFRLTVEQALVFDRVLLHESVSLKMPSGQFIDNKSLDLEAFWIGSGDLVICYTCRGDREGSAITLTTYCAKDLSKYLNVSLKNVSLVESKTVVVTDEDPMACIRRRTDENLRRMFG